VINMKESYLIVLLTEKEKHSVEKFHNFGEIKPPQD